MKLDISGLTSIYIKPGEACFSSNPIAVSTVLGSCISITMFSRSVKYAGISHCQLPNCRDCDSNCDNCLEPYKYVNCTIHQMIKKFEKFQVQVSDIEVKLFGGADVLKTTSKGKKISTVGKQNIQMAIETLAGYNILAAASDVGGKKGRKIIFLTETGEIYLARLNNEG